MTTKKISTPVRMLQIVVVFVLSALFSRASFAAPKPSCDMKHMTQQAAIFNANIDPELKVSIDVNQCRVTLIGRKCGVTPFTAYQLTTLDSIPDENMLQAAKIRSFGPNAEGTGYILAIPKCAG